MKIVINRCFGGFSLSPKAALECYKRGMTELARLAEEYYNFEKWGKSQYEKDLKQWQNSDKTSGYMIVFSDDEKFVIKTRPKNRTHPILIQVVEEMGDEANGDCASLEIRNIPNDINYYIHDYDGMESINENHRSW